MGEQGKDINKKQADLENNIEEFPLLETCKKQIKPFEEFWKAFAEIAKNEDVWYQTPVNELDTQEIQSQWKKLNSTLSRLENAFSAARNKKLEGLAKGRKDFLMKFLKKIPVIRALTTHGLKEIHNK